MTKVEEQQDVSSSVSPLNAKIIKQIEYYFGDFNLPRDKFLQEKVKLDEGWVPIETLLTFNRLKSLTEEESIVADAISQSTLLEVSDDRKKVRRNLNQPLPESTTERQQKLNELTVYAKGFPTTTTIDELLEFFGKFGRCLNVYMRRLPSTRKFKGSVFATFDKEEDAKSFVSQEGIKYNELELTRYFKKDYHQQKKITRAVRLAEKAQKEQQKQKESSQEEEEEETEVILGCLLRLQGLGEGTSWESVKQALSPYAEVAFVDYARSKPEAVVRFVEEGSAQAVVAKLGALEEPLSINGTQVTFSVLEGDEEAEYWKKLVTAKKEKKSQQKRGQKRGGQNRGGQNQRGQNQRGRGGRQGGRKGRDKNDAKRGATDEAADDAPAKKAKTEEAAD